MLQTQIARLSDVVGLDSCNVKILVCALLSFPFSFVFKRLPDHNYTLKNVYNIAVSAFYVFGICDIRGGISTLLISSLGCYFITRYVQRRSMPWINFFFLMGHLMINHFHNQFFNVYDPTVIDITGAQMVLVMKLSAFGWNIHDGRYAKTEELWPYARERVIKKHPNLLPYFGYVFYYASLLTGPAFDYADYDQFIHGTLFADVPDEKRPGKRKRVIPRSGKQAFAKTMRGFFWAFLFVNVDHYVSIPAMMSPGFTRDHWLVYRMFYMWVLGFSYRLKYYAIWSIAEGACILGGIGYNGYDEKTKQFRWNRVQNIDEVAFETGQNVHVCLEAWNMNTNKWLKNYIYMRLAKKGARPGFKSTLATFATSAIWHGTRPGYYLTFITGALMQSVGRIYRRSFRPIFLAEDGTTALPSKRYYDVVCYFVNQLAFGLAVQPFMLLDLGTSLQCWASCYFWVHLGIAATYFAFRGPYAKPLMRFLKSKQPVEQAKIRAARLTAANRKLSADEKKSVASVVDRRRAEGEDVFDYYTLGLPSFDVLESVDPHEFDEDIADIKQAWQSFKERKGRPQQEDLDAMKDTFGNFKQEVDEIIASLHLEAKSAMPTSKDTSKDNPADTSNKVE
ncbi:lysophospholipid acyltransferase [Diutina catenulata]